MADRAMRPFWIHQLAEYLIGVALIASGFQDPEPLVPVLAGILVMANTSIARSPLGAFRLVGRGLHRWLDLVVIAALLFGAVQPWQAVEVTGRAVMLIILVPMGFLWFYTDWAERKQRSQRRADRAQTGDELGRRAGRMAANTYLAGKRAVKKRSES